MPQTIRFRLDENYPQALAEGMRRRGLDVTTTPGVGLRGASDADQIAFGLTEGRVIFTRDDDFLRLHANGVSHAGIAYCRPGTRSLREIIDGLELIGAVYKPEEMRNRVECL